MSGLRTRLPFKFRADDTQDESSDERILDDQEQEEVIENLSRDSRAASTSYRTYAQALVGLSLVLHTIYLLDPDKSSPLYLGAHPGDATGMPFPRLFALYHILLHVNFLLFLLPASHHARTFLAELFSDAIVAPPYDLLHLPFAVALWVAPVFVLLSPARGQWQEVVWWMFPVWMQLTLLLLNRWERQAEEDLTKLQGLRYQAPGA